MKRELQQPCEFELEDEELSTSESPLDIKQTKIDLLSKLNEMKKAIDGYKEQKTKENDLNEIKNQQQTQKTSNLAPSNSQKIFNITSIQKDLTIKTNDTNLNQEQQNQQLYNNNEQFVFSPQSVLSEEFNQIIHEGNLEFTQKSLQQYLISSSTIDQKDDEDQIQEIIVLESQEVQCNILDSNIIQDLNTKHRNQLENFEQQLSFLKHQVTTQSQKESYLEQAYKKLQEDFAVLQQQKQESEKREEDMVKQSEELVMIVEDQTNELKDKDKQIQHLLQFEQKFFELKSEQESRSLSAIKPKNDSISTNTNEFLEQIDDLKDKLASEFNKKRKMKQEYDDQILELNEDLEYYKEKYNEMKGLLNNCREQLKQFEELNQMRNDVIDKLETENRAIKQVITEQFNTSQNLMTNQYSNKKSLYEGTPMQQTPLKQQEKSFSLCLQQVMFERTNILDQSKMSRANDFTLAQSERKRPYDDSIQRRKREDSQPMQIISELGSPRSQPIDLQQYLQPVICETMPTQLISIHENMVPDYHQQVNDLDIYSSQTSISQYDKAYQQLRSSDSSSYASPDPSQRQQISQSYLNTNNDNLDKSSVSHHNQSNESYITKISTNKENTRKPQIEYCRPATVSDQKPYIDRGKQIEQLGKPFRLLSCENRDNQQNNTERNSYKKPFDYCTQQHSQGTSDLKVYYQENPHTQYHSKIQAPLGGIPEEQHNSTTLDISQTDQTCEEDYPRTGLDRYMNKSQITESETQINHHHNQSMSKSSIRDEIKKLHHNINSLRAKMSVNHSKQISKNSSICMDSQNQNEQSYQANRRYSRDNSAQQRAIKNVDRI